MIGEWSRRWPDANIGIATGIKSGVLVIDIDTKNGKNGQATLGALAKQGKVLPPSPIALTSSGGRHLYFRAVAGIRNVVQVTKCGRGLGAGLDVRADGGFVVAPPSRLTECDAHGAGSYRWLVPPMTADFSRLPEWTVKMLQPPPAQPRPAFHADADGGDIEGLARWVSSSIEGERSNRLHWAACRAGEMAKSRRLLASAAGLRLVKAAEAAGLTSREAARAVDSGFQKSGLRYEP